MHEKAYVQKFRAFIFVKANRGVRLSDEEPVVSVVSVAAVPEPARPALPTRMETLHTHICTDRHTGNEIWEGEITCNINS